MRYYGLDKTQVNNALDKARIFLPDERFMSFPIRGTFFVKNEKIFLQTTSLDKKDMEIETGISLKTTPLEQLNNSEKTQMHMVRLINKKTNTFYYTLTLSSGDTKEEADKALQDKLRAHYVKAMQINSKKALLKVINSLLKTSA